MKIYFIRHGETNWNKERKLQGRSDIPLNEYGRKLAQITAEAFREIPFDLVYSSPLIRARETADILTAGHNLPIHEDDRLLEMSFGQGEGEALDQIHSNPKLALHNFIHDPAHYIPPMEGETFEDLYTRCDSFIKEILLPAQRNHDCVLVVAHGALIRGMIHCINQRPSSDFWIKTHKNCAVTIAECIDGKLSLLEEGVIFYKEEVEATW